MSKFCTHSSVQRIVLTLLLLSVASSILMSPASAATYVEITLDPNDVVSYNNFAPGFVLHGDAYAWSSRSTLRELTDDANFKMIRIFADHIMSPCTRWYESSKTGSFRWSNIDSLVQQIFAMGAEPLITMGFYNWERERITTPSGMSHNPTTGLPYTDQWGAYCAEWVEHFRNVELPVKYYEIVNEPHHYFGWGPSADRTKLRYFIDLFNAAAKAMRAENPNVKLGNDNSIMKLVLDYFIDYGEDLDFISFHTYGTGSLSASDSTILNVAETKFLGETGSVYGVHRAREIYRNERGVYLPVINTENNANYHYGGGTDSRLQEMLGAVYTALCIRTFILQDINYNLYYTFGGSGSSSVNFGMVNLDNNRPWYPYHAQEMIGANLAVGDPIVDSTSSSSNVRVLPWINNENLNILLISKSTSSYSVQLEGVNGYFTYQKIDNSISWRNAAVQTGTIQSSNAISLNGYTIMLLQQEASTPPPPSPPPPSLTPPSTSNFEDEFESRDFSQWTGTTTTTGESATVVNAAPYRGTYHGRFATSGSNDLEHAYCYKTINSEEAYARGYFCVAGGLPLYDDSDRFYFLRFRADDQSITGAGIRRYNGIDTWIIYARDGSSWAGPIYADYPVDEYRWYCVELHWRKSASQGLVELFVDGEKILELTGLDTDNHGNIDEVDFGLVSATNMQNALSIYGDSFELSNAYIGPTADACDNLFEDDFESQDFSKWTRTMRARANLLC